MAKNGQYLVIPVLKKHIKEGSGGDTEYCAIAIAAKEELEKQGYDVGEVSVGSSIRLEATKETDSMTCNLHVDYADDEKVGEFVKDFDELKDLENLLANGEYGEDYSYESRKDLMAAISAQRAVVQPIEIRIPL